jgi:drug/metabolite transporter (DMT)-like permease
VWTWAIRGESMGAWTLFGGALIVGAAAATVFTDARRDR